MPLIDDEEFLKICNELDRLKESEKDLKKGYIDLKLENNRIYNYKKYRNLIILILLISVIILFRYVYIKRSEFNRVTEQKYSLEKLIDSIGKEEKTEIKKESLPKVKEDKVVFAVQIGIFKEFNIPDESSKLIGGVRKLPNEKGIISNKYIAGEFYTYEKAKIFRNEIRKIGIKDAFIVSIYKGKKIAISKAIKLSTK